MQGLDEFLFYKINGLELSDPLESILVFFRSGKGWLPLYIVMLLYFAFRFRKSAISIVLLLVLVVGFTDFTNSKALKTAFGRERPCKSLSNSDLVLRVPCGSGKSFPSSHAANHMALAVMLIRLFGNCSKMQWVWLFLPWAVLVGFSQVFVGVHYPLDVLAGFFYGFCTASAFFILFKILFPKAYLQIRLCCSSEKQLV